MIDRLRLSTIINQGRLEIVHVKLFSRFPPYVMITLGFFFFHRILFSSLFLRQFLYLLDDVIIGVLHLGEDSETDGSSYQQPSQG